MSGLQTDNLTVGYGSPLVKEISLCVRPGRVLTLIGPNGCGKSTILKSVTRQLKIMGGSIFLGGQAMETMKEAEIAKKLAMVMTEHIRPELMTCRDIVATGRYPYTGRLGILTEADWQKVEEAIAFVHAEDVAVQDFNKVSDGQRQRIMLARAICQETEILVLDEPTSYLDIRYKLDILSGIRRLAKEKNVAVIMSLHELDLAQQVSDLIACVEDGGIVIDTPEKIFSGNRVQKLYGVADAAFDPLLGVPCMLDAEDRKLTDPGKDPKGGRAPEVFVAAVRVFPFTEDCSGKAFRLPQVFYRKTMWNTESQKHWLLMWWHKEPFIRSVSSSLQRQKNGLMRVQAVFACWIHSDL